MTEVFMRDPGTLAQLSKQFAQQLDELPDHDAVTDVFDYLAGAIYSLKQCEALRSWNRKGGRLTNYKKKVSQYLSEIPNGKPPNEYWISGYFLNSTMLRIAACYDRIPKLILKRDKLKRNESAHTLMNSVLASVAVGGVAASFCMNCPSWKAVYKEVNKLKHDRSSFAGGRSVSKDDVKGALEEIASLLEAKKNEIAHAYRTA